MKNPKAIIISRTDSIGDVVLTLPMLGILKKHFPNAKVIFLGKKYTRPIAVCCENIDEFVDWDELKSKTKNEQKGEIQSLKADAVLHVFPDKEIATLARSAKISLRIGTSHRLFHLFTCNKRLNFTRKNSDLHEAQLNLKLLSPFGINENYSVEELPKFYGFSKIKPLPDDLKSLIDKNRFNLILHPKSKGSAREWGVENFSRLIEILPKEKFKIFITGTKEEGEMMNDFISKNSNAMNLTGKLSLDELISFISSSDGLVAASTGPLHIAAALGKKAVGIYTPMRPIHPGRWMPIGQNASYLALNKECSDCRKSFDCKCIRGITPEDVMKKLHIGGSKNG